MAMLIDLPRGACQLQVPALGTPRSAPRAAGRKPTTLANHSAKQATFFVLDSAAMGTHMDITHATVVVNTTVMCVMCNG